MTSPILGELARDTRGHIGKTPLLTQEDDRELEQVAKVSVKTGARHPGQRLRYFPGRSIFPRRQSRKLRGNDLCESFVCPAWSAVLFLVDAKRLEDGSSADDLTR